MANIPLAEIPGVGGLPNPILTNYPDYRVNLGPGPDSVNGSLARIAGNEMQSPVSERAFAGPGLGLEQLGNTIAGQAGIFSELSNRMMDSKNYADLARAETVMNDAKARHSMETGAMPGEQRQAIWEKKYRPEVDKQIGSLKLSAWSRDRIEPQWISFDAKVRTGIAYDSYKREIADGEQASMNRINQATIDGDLQSAYSHADGLRAFGYGNAQIEKVKIDIDNSFNVQGLSRATNESPRAVLEEMKEARENKTTPKSFPWMKDPAAQMSAENAARALVNRRGTDAVQKVHTGMIAGAITNLDQIKETAGGDLDETQVAALEKSMTFDPAYNPETVVKLRTEISGITFKPNDDMSEYNRIFGEILAGVPKNLQPTIMGELKKAFDEQGAEKKPQARSQAAFEKLMQSNGENGFFGPVHHQTTKKGERIDLTADQLRENMQSWGAMDSAQIKMREYWNQNPNSTWEDWTNTFNSEFGKDGQNSAAQQFGQEKASGVAWPRLAANWMGVPIFDFSKPRGNVPPEQINEKLKKNEPASIRYNNPGAMYPGASSKKFGSTGVRTIGGGHSIAVFPDAESGAAAQFDLLDRSYAGMTMRAAVKKWSGGNSVDSYLGVIEQNAGIDADAVLTKQMLRDPAIAIPLVRAMAKQESGKEYPLTQKQWTAAHKRAFSL